MNSALWHQQRIPLGNRGKCDCREFRTMHPHAICTKVGVKSLSAEPMMASYTSFRICVEKLLCRTHTEAAACTTWKKLKTWDSSVVDLESILHGVKSWQAL